MNSHFVIRTLLDIALAASVIWGFWSVALVISLVGLWIFPCYIEALIAGFAFDALFGLGRGWGVWSYAGTITAVAVFFFISILRSVFRR